MSGCVSLLLLACRDEKSQPQPLIDAPLPTAVAEKLKIDASTLEIPTDPKLPSIDLRKEVEQFTSIDECAKQNSAVTPLVGDGLAGLGYDTFLRDACRILEAIKTRHVDKCDPIASPSLRHACRTRYAISFHDPDVCPFAFSSKPEEGRAPACVAEALRDVRLCSATTSHVDSVVCEAIVMANPLACKGLLPSDRGRCEREVSRIASYLAERSPASSPSVPVGGTLEIETASDPEAFSKKESLSEETRRGWVLQKEGTRVAIAFGSPHRESGSLYVPSPNSRARIGGVFRTTLGGGHAEIQRLEIEIPGKGTIGCPGGACTGNASATWTKFARGERVDISFDGTVSFGSASFRIRTKMTSMARDIVDMQAKTP